MSGRSQLGVEPRPHIHGVSLNDALGRGHDKYMREFQARLIRFVVEEDVEDDMHRPEVEDQEVAHQTGIEAPEDMKHFGIEDSEEECNSSEESSEEVDNVRPINGDTEQHSKVPDSPTMVEETQETFSSNFNKQEDDQETVPTQSFIRNLFSETKLDDR